jgi:hypothetical protein
VAAAPAGWVGEFGIALRRPRKAGWIGEAGIT